MPTSRSTPRAPRSGSASAGAEELVLRPEAAPHEAAARPASVFRPNLLDRRLLFVSGKGGVGKSTVTAALAFLAAEQGQQVLLVEVDAKGNLTKLFEHPPVGFDPVQIHPGVFAMQLSTEASLREYLHLNLHVPVFGRLGPVASVLDFVASAAPGVKEILTVGKVCWEVRAAMEDRAPWDLVVVDAAATGHVIAQLDAPRTIREIVHAGPIRGQTEWMIDLLADPHLTALNVVTSPEEMPVNETIELVHRAHADLEVPLGAVIVNRVLPELFTVEDEPVFRALDRAGVATILEDAAGAGASTVVAGARLAVALRRSRVTYLEQLRQGIDVPLLYVPYLFARDHGLRVTRLVAEALGQEMGL